MDEFSNATYDDWLALVEKDLKGKKFEDLLISHTLEGIGIQPLYYEQPPIPIEFPPHSPWKVAQLYSARENSLNKNLESDLSQGLQGALLRVFGHSPSHWMPQLSPLKESAAFLIVDTDPNFITLAKSLMPFWESYDKAHFGGSLNADPLAALAQSGALPSSLEIMLQLLAELSQLFQKKLPNVNPIGVSTLVYHNAGCDIVQELAFSMATAQTYLKRVPNRPTVWVTLAAETDFFLTLAKFRAARFLWNQLDCDFKIQAVTSERILSNQDPWTNLLRNTVASFGAALGGADSIVSLPHDYFLTQSSRSLSRRLARNIQLILQLESHVAQVQDPAAGSWFLENLTDSFIRETQARVSEIEQMGGMQELLLSGVLKKWIDATYDQRQSQLRKRTTPITGVSDFPNLKEPPWKSMPS